MPPKGKPKKKAAEEKLESNEVAIDVGIKSKKIAKVEKVPKKNVVQEVQNNDLTELNGSGDQIEEASESEVPTNNKAASKRQLKSAKPKGKIELSDDKEKEENPKVLPAKRGRRAAKIENVDSTKGNKDDAETKTEVESSNLKKELNNSQSEETNTEINKKTKIQLKESSPEKEVPAKGVGRKRKNAIEKPVPEKVKDKKADKIDGNRQLRVALKRNRSLDEMARQQRENDGEEFEEPKVKNAKGPTKGKGKRAAKDTTEDSQPTKKTKEDTKSKGAAKKEKIPEVTALDFSNKSKTSDGKSWNFKIANWNINGLRAWLEKNGLSYLHHEKPDILCVQETKCSEDKLPTEVVNIDGYHCHWLAGDKDGYSGVGLLSKEKPISVQNGIGIEEHDNEGRVITAEYEEFYLVTTYIPNAGRGLVRLDYRQKWDKDFRNYIKKLDEKKPVILCGDLNVAHEEIDLANPKSNKKNAGFTKEEREGFSTLLSEGFVDTFRHLYPDQTGAYTFWTYMNNARAKNVGWRLDYFVISKRFVDHLCDSVMRKEVYGSDHCPIALFLHM